ncbi:MAG: 2-C-methyl-D-erythritol 4-phosphate cytidylyltransferase [Alistipes sp.]|nr:2-C-methyl-D-erythritol 4-phosphate cytidylyltransferase [Alistipes sp.]
MEKIKEEITRGIVIVAGGIGSRMGSAIPKQFALVGGEPVLVRTINAFATTFPTSKIVVVLPASQIAFWKNLSARFTVARHSVVEGGEQRFHSVQRGIEALSGAVDYIAIHDGVRPFVSRQMIKRVAECAERTGTAVPVVHPVDSFRIEREDGSSQQIDRSPLRIVQTPQIFEAGLIRAAYDTEYDKAFTDDSSVVERVLGYKVTLCEGERSNIKITTPEDLAFGEAILRMQSDKEANEEADRE